MTAHVLIVEDNTAIAELIEFTLVHAGYTPIRAESAERALACTGEMLPVLALIDWMLPGMSGLSLVQKLRQAPRTAHLPIIMVTARVEESHRVTGLEYGADDYLTKPFSPRELIARIRALLRRRAPESSDATLTAGPLRLEPAAHAVTFDGRRIDLRLIEFKMLRLMMAHPNRVFDRTQLLDRIWGDHVFIEERTVDVHIRRLRIALGPDGRDMVVAVRGGGYKLAVSEPAAAPDSGSTPPTAPVPANALP